jgi:hypothetical protein
MSAEEREVVEKYIEKELSGIEAVDRFYVEKKNRDSIDVIVVSSRLTPSSASAITGIETKINRDFRVHSDFKIYPAEAWRA